MRKETTIPVIGLQPEDFNTIQSGRYDTIQYIPITFINAPSSIWESMRMPLWVKAFYLYANEPQLKCHLKFIDTEWCIYASVN